MTPPTIVRRNGYLPISSYALIGNCHTAALVGADGSIDFVCPGRFDAPAVFCSVLDAEKGGYLHLAPKGDYSIERQYVEGTGVLQTLFRSDGFTARVTDFMPISGREPNEQGQDVETAHELIRLVEGVEGEGEFELRFKPTFSFAEGTTRCDVQRNAVLAGAGDERIRLDVANVEFHPGDGGMVTGTLTVRPGDRQWVVLSKGSESKGHREETCEQLLRETCAYWERWSGACTYRGPYRDHVVRSAITLKLLTFEPTGAVVAAPTTSLPEWIGGERNWDYRYTWLRDSALILYALMSVGYEGEASDFMRWLHRTLGSDRSTLPQIMYTIDGGRQLPEHKLDSLSGYRDSRPVRVGNGAAMQTQLDIYGEVLMAADVHFCDGHRDDTLLHSMWPVLRWVVDDAAKHWREKDAGIWEVRGGPRDFLYSKLLCWAALDRGLHLAESRHLSAPTDQWRKERDAIRSAIMEHAYDEKLGAFTQSFGSDALDSSALIIPRIGFLPATDPRVQSTVRRIQQDLTHNGLVYRYRTQDGLAGGEGTFTLCTYWLVDALALGGQLDEAHEMFERLLGYANDLGLLSEEINPDSGDMLGNFPQGFSHLALVQSAVNLAKTAKHGPEQHAESMGTRATRAGKAAAQPHGRPARATW